MTESGVDVEAVLADLKDFQRRTAVWAFERMFAEEDPAIRFLVADEVGLGKTHVAKGVIAQVIDYLGRSGDKRHDIVYICSNAAIARQNIRKLAPPGIRPLESVDRLTMLPLTKLNDSDGRQTGTNLLAITPGTSLKFGRSTGRFRERCLAYTFLRAHWGRAMRAGRARRVFWEGVNPENGDGWLRWWEREYRPNVSDSRDEFARTMAEADSSRLAGGLPTLLELFDGIVSDMPTKRALPLEVRERRKELIGAVRSIMAQVGIARLSPDLIILDEFQRFKELLHPEPGNFAAELAHGLFGHSDPETGRATRTLLLSATPYRMYTTADEIDEDHYQDFLETCSFLFGHDPPRIKRLQDRFRQLRTALTALNSLDRAEALCEEIRADLRAVMARTERLSATPDRDGMLTKADIPVAVKPQDLRAYLRFGGLAEAVKHHEPAEYWKSAPYLVNFMEEYKFKEAIVRAVKDGQLAGGGMLDPGSGLLSWDDIEKYQQIDPQNGRLRWLLDDLESHRAFELLWVPPSMRYYDTGSVYESPEAAGFTKRLIFSGWTVVPKVVSSLVSFEAERRAFASDPATAPTTDGGAVSQEAKASPSLRRHDYSDDYGRRGGQRLDFRTTERSPAEPKSGEASSGRRAASMTAFLLAWPSPILAELGDPRRRPPREHRNPAAVRALREAHRLDAPSETNDGSGNQESTESPQNNAQGARPLAELLAEVEARIASALDPMIRSAPTTGPIDRRWYWAAPLLLDHQHHQSTIDALLPPEGSPRWKGDQPSRNMRLHMDEARAMIDHSRTALGRPPRHDLEKVLAELAVGGPAQCALRTISSVTGLPLTHDRTLANAAYIAEAFRGFFNAPEVTAVVASRESDDTTTDEGASRYWQDVLRHSIDGNLQAVLDEHGHVLRDWLGYLSLDNDNRRWEAADEIAAKMGEALELRTSSYRVDFPVRKRKGRKIKFGSHRMRTRFAVAFANQRFEDGGEARLGSVSAAFNSPFWPFVLTSTSIGQEGLDFHLWCHAVVHWNLPYNPVDLEQREGRVHRYKGHAVRRNIASTHGDQLLTDGLSDTSDPWAVLFAMAADRPSNDDSEMVPYWVYKGPAKIERHVPVMPFSREEAALPRLRKALAAYRLAFGQPRQEELVEFLGAGLSEEQLTRLAKQLRIDLSPPELTQIIDS